MLHNEHMHLQFECIQLGPARFYGKSASLFFSCTVHLFPHCCLAMLQQGIFMCVCVCFFNLPVRFHSIIFAFCNALQHHFFCVVESSCVLFFACDAQLHIADCTSIVDNRLFSSLSRRSAYVYMHFIRRVHDQAMKRKLNLNSCTNSNNNPTNRLNEKHAHNFRSEHCGHTQSPFFNSPKTINFHGYTLFVFCAQKRTRYAKWLTRIERERNRRSGWAQKPCHVHTHTGNDTIKSYSMPKKMLQRAWMKTRAKKKYIRWHKKLPRTLICVECSI